MVTRPVLRYFGGKWRIAPWILSYFPPHRIYCEPFGGAASVLLRKPRSFAEVYNDRDGDIVNLFRVLRDRPDDLTQAMRLTPVARDEYDLAHERTEDPVEGARRLIIRSFLGYGSDSATRSYKSGFRAVVTARRNPAMDFTAYDQLIPMFNERLRGVIIENRDAFEVIEMQDGPGTLHFLDPPYVHETRSAGKHGYRFELTNEDHVRLCDRISGLQGMVILCGYENPIYERLRWRRVERSARVDGGQERTEVLWMNPACAGAQPDLFATDRAEPAHSTQGGTL